MNTVETKRFDCLSWTPFSLKRDEMYSVRRIVLGAVLSWVGVALLSMLGGCKVTPPNLLIQPIPPQEISGQYGYITILPTGGSDVVAFRMLNWEVVNTKPVFFLVIFDGESDNDVCVAVSLLLQAKEIRVALQRPKGVPHLQKKISLVSDVKTRKVLTRYLILTKQDGTTTYLKATLPDFSVEFTTMVNKPAELLRIRGFEESEPIPFIEWLAMDPVGPAPAMLTEVRYISSDQIETDIHRVREKQERLIQSTYGERYQDDLFLHRAIRVEDKINERYGESWIVYLEELEEYESMSIEEKILFVYDGGEHPGAKMSKTRSRILQQETGLDYYTAAFAYDVLLVIYEAEKGVFLPTAYGIDIEFLRLHFTYPNESQGQLVERFKQSVRSNLIITENPFVKD